MRFKEAIEKTPALQDAWRKGVQALLPRDKKRIPKHVKESCSGSVNVDKALKATYPDKPRWDYAMSVPANSKEDCVCWVEIHPATEGKVKEVLDKHAFLKTWMKKKAPHLNQMKHQKFIWIASGKRYFSLRSPSLKRLRDQDVLFGTREFVKALKPNGSQSPKKGKSRTRKASK